MHRCSGVTNKNAEYFRVLEKANLALKGDWCKMKSFFLSVLDSDEAFQLPGTPFLKFLFLFAT